MINKIRNTFIDIYQPEIFNICTQACPPKINPCDFVYEALQIDLSANHGCNDAEFDVYIRLYEESIAANKNVWLYITRLNLNTTDHNRTIGGNNPALAQIILSEEIVTRANKGKKELQNRELCCQLDLKLFACWFSNETPYFQANPILPLENDTDKYLPPLGQDSLILEPRNRSRIHTNIISTTITRISDGTILVPGVIWYGGLELDLCIGLDGPGQQLPEEPIVPVI